MLFRPRNLIPPYSPEMSRAIRWDSYFLEMAKLVSTMSKDPSTKCGAVIVRPDRSVVSTGYNGFPRGVEDKPFQYANREEKYQRIIHAEVNAVLQARCNLDGCTLYTWPQGLAPTCDRCATVVIQAGIRRIVYVYQDNDFTRRWSPERSHDLYSQAGIMIGEYVVDG